MDAGEGVDRDYDDGGLRFQKADVIQKDFVGDVEKGRNHATPKTMTSKLGRLFRSVIVPQLVQLL